MTETVLETIGLAKDFGRRRVVDNLNLTVMAGDIYGFLGPNGAGKSTTIRMITGLVRPSSGGVRLMNFDIRTNRERAMSRVGALVESASFYKFLGARENLRIFARLSGGCDSRRIDEVLDTVGLLDRANDKVGTFSQGMRQRLGIAQALLPNPALVILDEPTNGLDPQGMRDVRELILRLAADEHITILISSHLLHEVEQICTRVGIINRGKLISEGPVDALLRRESDVVEFSVSDAGAAEGVFRSLGLDVVQASTAQVCACVPCERVAEVNRALVGTGIDVSAIVPKSLSLEDLFLELVEGDANAG